MNELIGEVFSHGVLRLTLSAPAQKDARFLRAVLRPLNGGWQLEKRTATQVFHENLTADSAVTRIAELFGSDFRNLEVLTRSESISARVSKGGKLLVSRKKAPSEAEAPLAGHNREKNYILREDAPCPALTELGVFTAEGRVAAPMYDKFRQINRFIEFIDDIVSRDSRREWSIIDFGCGKSYLTFVVYHYLTALKGLKATITGLDLKREVIENCSALAEKLGYDGLRFEVGDIGSYKTELKPDMVITLHACDTATDMALANAVAWGAEYILSVPCCQHELNGQLASDDYPLLTDYGIIKERFAALLTDSIRARLLERSGYKVQVLEFVDIAHSPKNLLLRASKRRAPLSAAQTAKLDAELDRLCTDFRLDPALRRSLKF